MTAPYPDQLDGALVEIGRLAALVAELLAALVGIVERGTDSPQHLAAEAAIAKAQGVTA